MSFTQGLHSKIRNYVKVLQKFSDRVWYPPFIGLLAALDNIIFVIPTDGLLISSSMLRPKRWLWLGFNIAIGSSVGAIALAIFVEHQGLEWILRAYPGINETKTWLMTKDFFDRFGILLVFGISFTPLMQQPAIIIASLAQTPLPLLAAAVFSARGAKYLIMSYISSHAPKLINKFWGIKGELEDVGVKPDP